MCNRWQRGAARTRSWCDDTMTKRRDGDGGSARHAAPEGADGTPRLLVGAMPMVDVVRWARAALARSGGSSSTYPTRTPRRPGARGSGRPRGPPHVACVGRPRGDARLPLPHAGAHRPDARARALLAARGRRRAGTAAQGDVERYDPRERSPPCGSSSTPGFLVPLLEALERVRPPDGGRVLVLGCHRGDEIEALGWLEPPPRALDVTGVDRAAGALEQARTRFPGSALRRGRRQRPPRVLGAFHLVVAIDVLQSPRSTTRPLLRRLVQRHLEPEAALLLGLPNSRFRGDEVVWGRAPGTTAPATSRSWSATSPRTAATCSSTAS
jgi:hypothetical protein